MKQSRTVLKSYFETGDKPTEPQFSDLIDSLMHLDDGVFVTNIEKDQNGNQVITFSDNTKVSIEKQTDHVVQDNKIRTINLGTIRSYNDSLISPELINVLNAMDPPINIAEDEIAIFEYESDEILES